MKITLFCTWLELQDLIELSFNLFKSGRISTIHLYLSTPVFVKMLNTSGFKRMRNIYSILYPIFLKRSPIFSNKYWGELLLTNGHLLRRSINRRIQIKDENNK